MMWPCTGRAAPARRQWSDPFVMADTPGFPDCNTCMMIDPQERLWLFWPTILANTWESCLTNYRVSSDYAGPGAPKWSQQGLILLKPDDFSQPALPLLDEALKRWPGPVLPEQRAELEALRAKVGDKLFQRLGWQPRCKPTVLPSGRIVLPLYTDTFSISIMALSDDQGKTWRASQPADRLRQHPADRAAHASDGTLVAYMRENGPFNKIRVSTSRDARRDLGAGGHDRAAESRRGNRRGALANGDWVIGLQRHDGRPAEPGGGSFG